MKEAAPTDEPTEETAPTEASTEEAAPIEEPNEEPATLLAMVCRPAKEPDVPPSSTREKEKGEVPHSNFPGRTVVLHPTWSVIPAGQTPLTLGELRQQCHSQSAGEEDPASKS